MRYFLILLFLFFLSHFSVSYGQQPVIIPLEQEFSFEPYPDTHSRISNELLQRISQGSGRLRAYTKFTMKGALLSNFHKDEKGNMTARFELKGIAYSGDVFYRDFSIEKILLPNFMDMTLHILDSGGNVVFDTIVKGARVPANGGHLLEFSLPGKLSSGEFTPEVSSLRFYYTQEALERFTGWFNALEQYYDAGSNLEKARQIIDNLDPSKVETLLLDEFALCEAEGIYHSVKNAGFHHWLDLRRSDPGKVMTLLEEMQDDIKPLRQGYNKAIAAIDSLYFEEGVYLLQQEQAVKARALFARAVTYNPFHIPSHCAIAEIDVNSGKKQVAIERMGNVIQIMYPSGNQLAHVHRVTDTILNAFFDESRELSWEHRYLDALKTLEPVEVFCEKVAGFMECPPELKFRITASHMGMYRSFLTVSARARLGDNLSFARTYITSALEYQKNNTTYLPDASEAYEQLQMLLDRHVASGYSKLLVQENDNAKVHFETAKDLCQLYSMLECPNELEEYYAASLLPQPKVLAERKDLPVYNSIYQNPESLYDEPIREQLLEKLSYGHLKAWAGELDEASNTLTQAEQMRLQYQLENDSLVNTRIMSLSLRIKGKGCELAQREYQVLLADVVRFKELPAIAHAATAARQALVLKKDFPDCGLKDNDTLILKEIIYADDYLKLIENAHLAYQNVTNNNFTEFFEKYQEAEFLFVDNELSALGLKHTSFTDFIFKSNNLELANAAVVFMTQWPERHLHDITSFLEALRLNGVRMADVQKAQEAAGIMLAIHFADHQGLRQVSQLKQQGGKWYQFLEDAFTRYQASVP